MGQLLYITGGARSGKSAQAERLALEIGAPVIYLATMQASDAELEARVAAHRARRPTEWTTLEEPLAVAEAVRSCPEAATVLLDCLSLWVSNRLFERVSDFESETIVGWEAVVEFCVSAGRRVVAAARGRGGTLIAVTNEVGLGIVPADRLSRYYRDALGMVNQSFSAAADEAYLMVSGLPLRLR